MSFDAVIMPVPASATCTPIPILKVEAGTLKEIVCSWLAVSPAESWWADEAISYIGTSTCDGIDGLLSGCHHGGIILHRGEL